MSNAGFELLPLCLWREARGVGYRGMLAVGFVLKNRVAKRKTSYDVEVMRPWQFSSMTAKGDPQLNNYPAPNDPMWITAQQIASHDLENPNVTDLTDGSTLYYDDSIDFPKSWDEHKVEETVKIGRLNFFKELV